MSKLTKMQINKIEETLSTLIDKKVNKFRSERFSAQRDAEVDIVEVGLKNAEKSPKVFIKQVKERMQSNQNYNQFLDVFRNMPDVIKATKKHNDLTKKHDKEIFNYANMLREKKDEELIKLYFDVDQDVIVKMIDSFKKL